MFNSLRVFDRTQNDLLIKFIIVNTVILKTANNLRTKLNVLCPTVIFILVFRCLAI